MQKSKKISLYDIIASTFPEVELFELDDDRQPVRNRTHELDVESLAAKLPLSGGFKIRLAGWRFSGHVFPTHPGYVCAVIHEEKGSLFNLEAAVSSVSELYFSIDEMQDDARSHNDGPTFLSRLFQMSEPDLTNITLQAADMDLDLSLQRLVAVFQVTPHSALDKVEELLRQKILPSHQDVFGAVSDDCIVCGKVLGDTDTVPEEIRGFFSSAMNALDLPEGVRVICGVGVVVSDMSEYPMSLRMAELALKEDKDISWVHEHILELVMGRVSVEMMYHFLGTYFIYLDNNPTMYDTVHALVRRNMDLAAAASDCGVHRNTLVFRLNQLRSVWDINPVQNDNDRFFLILLDHCYRNLQKRTEE